MTYAIVFSTVSKMLRRVIADDDGNVSLGEMPDGTPAVICSHPNAPPGLHPLMPGESAIIEEPARGRATTPHDWPAAVRARTGIDPPTITCALVDDSNTVTSVIRADPDVDASPSEQHLMIHCYSTQIIVGCTYDPATGLFTTMEGLIPVGAPGNDTDQPIIVPPTVILKPDEA